MPVWVKFTQTALREERRRLVVMLMSLLGLAVAQSLFLLLIKGFVMAMFADPHAPVPLDQVVSHKILAFFPAWQDVLLPREQLAYLVPAAILLAGVLQAGMTYLFQISQQGISLALAKSIRDRLFHAIVSLPYAQGCKKSPATWMSILMNDVLFVQMRFSDILTGVVKGSVLIVAGLLFLAVVHWPSAAILTVVSPLIAWGMGRTGRRIAVYADEYQRQLGEIASGVLEVRKRFEFIRAHRGEETELSSFQKSNKSYYDMIRRSILVRSAFAPGLEFIGVAIFALFIYATGRHWMSVRPEDLLYFFGAMGILLRPLRTFGEQIARGQETLGAMRSSLDLLVALEEQSATGAQTPATSEEMVLPQTITIRRVEAGMDRPVVCGEQLVLERGKAIAVVGPSGSGKSTLAKTFAGLLVPCTWDASVTADDLGQTVSFVSQDPFLFQGSLKENLAYGLSETPRDDVMWDALAKVGMKEEWQQDGKDLEGSLYAMAGNTSGGQLQRLVVARSLLRGKPFFLFDEATSAIDSDAEKAMVEMMLGHCRHENKLFMAITHRLATLPQFDLVWFVDGGKVAFVGKHEDLLKEDRYRQFVESGGEA